MSFLLDTNVVSELRKGPRANPGVRGWVSSVEDGQLYISTIVIGELRQGVERLRRRDAYQAEALDDWLDSVKRDYTEYTVPVTAEIAEQWGRLNVPDRLPAIDGLLAATAHVRHLTLVTRNTKDVECTGIKTHNPFT